MRMNKEEKRDLKKKLAVDTSKLPFEMILVNKPIEQVIELEEYEDIVKDTRRQFREQLEEACVDPIDISCPYKTDVLDGDIGYETSDWLIIYGIEILEGSGDFTMCIPCGRQEILKIHSNGSGNFVSPQGIIVPELTDFIIESGDNQPLRYRLVGEGNNNPKMDFYIERTYRRTPVEDRP
jgi:hypothetical protein